LKVELKTKREIVQDKSMIRSIWYKIRGTLRAPFGLLRRYFFPILAFAIVFGAVLYFLP